MYHIRRPFSFYEFFLVCTKYVLASIEKLIPTEYGTMFVPYSVENCTIFGPNMVHLYHIRFCTKYGPMLLLALVLRTVAHQNKGYLSFPFIKKKVQYSL